MVEITAFSGIEKPIVTHLNLTDEADPYLEGLKCRACGEVFIGLRTACAKCLSRDGFDTVRLSDRGRLYNWTIVYRNFPGIKVPFVSAIVDLDGGGTIKGNLVDIDPDPATIAFNLPVKLEFRPIEQADADGNRYIGYVFVPASKESAQS